MRQNARETGATLIEDIPLEDFPLVVDQLMYVLKSTDSTYHTYSRPLNPQGFKILADLSKNQGRT